MAKNLRQDITGLRAIAVLAVTLFHIDHVMLPQIDLFKGGFLGVDIFFVISGFLMTMLIMRKGGGLQSGDFSLLKFYQRRAKRICPALIATIGSCYKLTLYPKWCKDSPPRKQGEWPRFHNIVGHTNLCSISSTEAGCSDLRGRTLLITKQE